MENKVRIADTITKGFSSKFKIFQELAFVAEAMELFGDPYPTKALSSSAYTGINSILERVLDEIAGLENDLQVEVENELDQILNGVDAKANHK